MSASPLDAVLGREERIVSALKRVRNEEEELFQTTKRLKGALAIHEILPYDILCQIFISVVEVYGPLALPFHSGISGTPPQLVLLSVCSEWRSIALSTAELWKHVKIERELSRWEFQVCHEWLRKAGSYPVALEVNLYSLACWNIMERDAVDFVQRAMSLQDLRVSKLRLIVSEEQFLALDQLTPDAVSHLDALELEIVPRFELNGKASLPHFIGHMNSLLRVEFKPENIQGLLAYGFPWGRLRQLGCCFENMTQRQVVHVLEHMSLLEELKVRHWLQPRRHDVPAKAISLVHLRVLIIGFYDGYIDDILSFFEYPNLKKLDIKVKDGYITDDNFDIFSRQYNLGRLERFALGSGYFKATQSSSFSKLSTILKEAPMLRYCFAKHSIPDEDAIAGIASGGLGQFLEHLDAWSDSSFEVILSMLEGRLQAVRNRIQGGRRWYEEVSLLKRVGLCSKIKEGTDGKRLEALLKADIKIEFKNI